MLPFKVMFLRSKNKSFKYNPPADPLKIIYKDSSLLVIDKQRGILSVPGRLPQHKDSVYSRASDLFGEVYPVHRLDMATSGLIIFARSKFAERYLMAQFRDRKIYKVYNAVVSGKLSKKKGFIDAPLIGDWDNRPKQKVDFDKGKFSLTEYEVLSYFNGNTYLKLVPVTGRTHQLRVHMSFIGHPILGDDLYGNSTRFGKVDGLFLNSSVLSVNCTFFNKIFYSEFFF